MLRVLPINILSVLILISAAQVLFMAVALVIMRRGNRPANLFLAALLLTLAILMIDGFMTVTNYYYRFPHLIGVVWPAYLLSGPFLYFYVRSLTSPKLIQFSGRQFLHVLPAVAAALLLIPFYSMSANEKIARLARSMTTQDEMRMLTQNVAPFLITLQKVVYYVLSYRAVAAYRSRIKQSFSSLDAISLSWLRTLLITFFLLCFLFIFFSFFAVPLSIHRETAYLSYLGFAVVTYVMAFKSSLQPEIFTRIEAAHRVELIRTDQSVVPDAPAPAPDLPQETGGMMSREKYQRSLLTAEQSAGIVSKLLQVMETEKPFLEPELTLPELANRLSISPHHLSQVINREMDKSFFDFVNEFRVQEAKRLLTSPQCAHLSILGIALDAGFNSKSAFYTAFAKYIGMTPSEFRKKSEWSGRGMSPNLPGSA
jgi:AraC-like DNA-binding protein